MMTVGGVCIYVCIFTMLVLMLVAYNPTSYKWMKDIYSIFVDALCVCANMLGNSGENV